MKNYLETLISEKGTSLDSAIALDGHFGLTYQMLVDFIVSVPESEKATIKAALVKIDFLNGDIFHYLKFLAGAMVKALGY